MKPIAEMIKGDWLYIEIPQYQISTMFLFQEVEYEKTDMKTGKKTWVEITLEPYHVGCSFRVSREAVRRVCGVGEGEPCFWWYYDPDAEAAPLYCLCPKQQLPNIIAVNALTTGRTVGELRTLIEWYSKEK